MMLFIIMKSMDIITIELGNGIVGTNAHWYGDHTPFPILPVVHDIGHRADS